MANLNGRFGLACAFIAVVAGASIALGQGTPADEVTIRDDHSPDWLKGIVKNPDSAEARAYASQQKRRAEVERDIRKIRFEYFRSRNKAARQEGVLKLHEYTDPAYFPLLVEVFKNDDLDVQVTIMDLLADTRTEEGDISLAWMGVFGKDRRVREEAVTRLQRRIKDVGQWPYNVRLVVYQGLRSGKDAPMAAAAGLANVLDMAEALPWLIATQVGGGGTTAGVGGGGGPGSGDLAYIVVGRQVAFISDLQPVVSESAVAFDPQLSTLTEGTILRISGATVIEYHTEINTALVDLSSRLWGQSTRELGWNVPAWQRWYKHSFEPFWAKKQQEEAAKQGAASANPG